MWGHNGVRCAPRTEIWLLGGNAIDFRSPAPLPPRQASKESPYGGEGILIELGQAPADVIAAAGKHGQ